MPFGTAQLGERTAPLEAEVVVEATRVVPLHDEARPVAGVGTLAERLGRLPGPAFPPILVEGHVLWIVA